MAENAPSVMQELEPLPVLKRQYPFVIPPLAAVAYSNPAIRLLPLRSLLHSAMIWQSLVVRILPAFFNSWYSVHSGSTHPQLGATSLLQSPTQPLWGVSLQSRPCGGGGGDGQWLWDVMAKP